MLTCGSCGHQNARDARFCASCDTFLDWGKRAAPAEPPAEPAAPATNPTTTPAASRDPQPTASRGTPPADPTDDYGQLMDDLRRLGQEPAGTQVMPPAAASAPPGPPRAAHPGTTAGIPAVVPSERDTRRPADRPAAAPAAPPPPSRPAPEPPPPGEGQVTCPRCGHRNEATRRFCRCGHQLDQRAQPAAPEHPPAEQARGGSGDRPPWQAGDVASQGRAAINEARGGYSRTLRLRTYVFRAAIILVVLGIGGAMLPPWGDDVRGWIADRLPQRYEPVAVEPAPSAFGDDAELAGFPAEDAVDQQPGTAWAAGWPVDAPPVPDACSLGPDAAPVALAVAFAEPATIERVTIQGGLDPGNPNAPKHARPSVVEIYLGDQTCERLTLEDTGEAQSFPLQLPAEASAATVTILGVHPAPADTGGQPRVSISEIAFETS